MKPQDWRNVLLVAVAAVLCLGGSFTCSFDGDGDKVNGHVNAILR